ncbi:hypothetical protein [Nocardia thraciensis]
MPPLVWLVWSASVAFAAALGFRVGVWWQRIHQPGQHAFLPGQRHRDEARTAAESHGGGTEEPTDPIPRPPAAPGAHRWPSGDADTEVLPKLQDIRPPTRPTPIRKPPWVDRPRRPRHRR